jgi:riboflavin synthase
MFTGLVERTGLVVEILPQGGSENVFTLKIDPGPNYSREHGASVSVNGVCLTEVKHQTDGVLTFHVSPETLSKTSLGQLKPKSKVNLERAIRPTDRFGGHMVLGHVDGVSRVLEVKEEAGFWNLIIDLQTGLSKYTVSKGSIAIDGVSLTINSIEEVANKSHLSFMLIPVTWQTTALSQLKVNDIVNIEVDILAKHVERLMRFKTQQND